jgi:hypothetical protein
VKYAKIRFAKTAQVVRLAFADVKFVLGVWIKLVGFSDVTGVKGS